MNPLDWLLSFFRPSPRPTAGGFSLPTTQPEHPMTHPFPYTDTDLLTLARTLYGEARGEPHDGQIAVAWIIRNRASRARFIKLAGNQGAVAAVCLAPWQFSCWNSNDPNRRLIEALTADRMPGLMKVAKAVLDGTDADPTNGGDHYHTVTAPAWAGAWPPNWAPTMQVSAQIGEHIFYDSTKPR